MKLSSEQQELLSAYLDGEVTANERALAKALLDRAEAKAYLEELSAVSARVKEHGGAVAPANFSASVLAALDGDFDSISRPTSNQKSAPVHSLPPMDMRVIFMAVAAAVVIAVGLLFGGVMSYAPQTQERSEIGLRKQPAQSPEPAGQPDASVERPSAPPSAKRPVGGGGAPDHSGPKKGPASGDPEEPRDNSKDGKTPGESAPDDIVGENVADFAALRKARFSRTHVGPDETEVTLSFNRSGNASLTQAYTAVLSVSALYGDAALVANENVYNVASTGTDFTEYRGVEITLAQSRVPELLAAIKRLSAGQSFGQVEVPGHLQREVSSEMREVEKLQTISARLSRGETPQSEDLESSPPAGSREAAKREKAEFDRRQRDPEFRRAVSYLPKEAQRASYQSLYGKDPSLELRSPAQPGESQDEDNKPKSERTVKLVIRFQ